MNEEVAKIDVYSLVEEQKKAEARAHEFKNISSTPVNLSNVLNLPKLITLTMAQKRKSSLESIVGHDVDRLFFLIGECAQAPGHVIVIGSSGKIYCVLHSDDFDVATPDRC